MSSLDIKAVRWVAAHSGRRDAKGRLAAFADAPPHFRPNLTPRQMLEKGMHGGIYFNPKGGKPGVRYPLATYPKGIPGVGTDELPAEWFEGVAPELYASRRYDASRNYYGVKSGLDQVGWETHGWINPIDPRGWTQWYFRFYMGRRLDGGEDERQIGRWAGVASERGRWRNNLVAKCMQARADHDDASVSPVVRQTLLHWAYELCAADFDTGTKRVAKRGATYVPRASLGLAKAERSADEADEVKAASAKEQKAAREERASKRAKS